MNARSTLRGIVRVTGLVAASLVADFIVPGGFVCREAYAVVGRPFTPVSYAGVARRTTRRTIRRSAMYVAALPPNTTTVVIEGQTLYQSGGTYYQKSGNQYVVVTVE
jgi:hypothetical protein